MNGNFFSLSSKPIKKLIYSVLTMTLIVFTILGITNIENKSNSAMTDDVESLDFKYDYNKINIFYNFSYINNYQDIEGDNVFEANYWILTQDLVNQEIISWDEINLDKENKATAELNKHFSLEWGAYYRYVEEECEIDCDVWYQTQPTSAPGKIYPINSNIDLYYYDQAIVDGYTDFEFNDNYNVIYGSSKFLPTNKDPIDPNELWGNEIWDDNNIEMVFNLVVGQNQLNTEPYHYGVISSEIINPIRITPTGLKPETNNVVKTSLSDIDVVGIINGVEDQRIIDIEFYYDVPSVLEYRFIDVFSEEGIINNSIDLDNSSILINIIYYDEFIQEENLLWNEFENEGWIDLNSSYQASDIAQIEIEFIFENNIGLINPIKNPSFPNLEIIVSTPVPLTEVEYDELYEYIYSVIDDINNPGLSNGAIIGIIVSLLFIFLVIFFGIDYKYRKYKINNPNKNMIDKLEEEQIKKLEAKKQLKTIDSKAKKSK